MTLLKDIIAENWTVRKSSGRGQHWVNYDNKPWRLQVTVTVGDEGPSIETWLAKIPNPSGKYIFDLKGISKSDVDKITKAVIKQEDPTRIGKQVANKYRRYAT